MPSRRRFLLGIGAVAVGGVGALACDTDRPRDAPTSAVSTAPPGPVAASGSSPAGPTSMTTPTTTPRAPGYTPGLSTGELSSSHVRNAPAWRIWVPDSPVIGVVYCLHGRGEDHRFAFDRVDLPGVVDAGRAQVAIAAVDGGPDSYWHRRMNGDDPLRMLLDEFIPMVDARLGVTKRALLGWSMGGYGALLAAETAPDRFRAAIAVSPALWTTPGATASGAFDGADDYRRNDVFPKTDALRGLVLRVDCGTSDPFYQATKTFVAKVTPAPAGSFGKGGHDDGYWRSVAPAEIATLHDVFAG